MVSASAEEVHGRLVLLGLCSAAGQDGNDQGHSVPSGRTFHQAMRAEVDGVLKDSFSRRLEKFEERVSRLMKGDGSPAADEGDRAIATNGCSSPTSGSVSVSEQSAQTNHTGQVVAPARLSEAYEKAMKHAMVCGRQPVKKFVEKKNRQNAFEEPQEKEEPVKKETAVMRLTLEALKERTASRERQITSLKSQIVVCTEYVENEKLNCTRKEETLESLKDKTVSSSQMHAEWACKRSAEKDTLVTEVTRIKKEAKRYEVLAKQQHAFFLQTEAIFQRTGQEKIQRFPAGDLFLMPQPLPMDEEEKVEEWDVGIAIANPYVVDSWPFEPNVLARRCSQECPMDEVREETAEDLMEAFRPVSRAAPLLNFPTRGDSDDDDDDGAGPSATSRSL